VCKCAKRRKKAKGDIKMKLKGFLAAVTAGVMLLGGCSAINSKNVAMTIGDKQISTGIVKFAGEKCTNSTDSEYVADAVKNCYLVYEIAQKMGIELEDSEKEQITSNVRRLRQNLGGKSKTDEILKEYDIEDDVLEVLMSTSVYSSKIMEDITVEEPTDDEVKETFKSDYLRAKQILISTENLDDDAVAEAEQKANEIFEKAKNGEDFDALITEYNEDPGMSSNPDGYFFTDGDMVKDFENATKSIQPEEITMCKTTYGYHIIKRLPLDESDANFEQYFESNKSSVKSALLQKKNKEALENKAEELGIKVTLNDDVINSIVIEQKQ
jgi:parvulin-like peptidyl-prolyl isomerase